MATTEQLTYPSKVMRVDITFADNDSTVQVGFLPPGSSITSVKAFVATAFDSVTSDALEIGYGAFGATVADPNAFEAAIDLQAAGDAALTLLNVGQVISATDNVPITVTQTTAGTAATAGAASVIIEYNQP